MLCSVAVVWANVAYLLVTIPLLISRRSPLAPGPGSPPDTSGFSRHGAPALGQRGRFSLGRFGVPINALAVVWGLLMVTNMSWPRSEIYGEHPWGRFAAPLSTLSLIALGGAYYFIYQRRRVGILPAHATGEFLDQTAVKSKNQTVVNGWIGRHAPGERETSRP
jgi:hypothetical protein